MKFDKNSTIGEIIEKAPNKVNLFEQAGMHCIGCAIAETESIENACAEFGIDVNDFLMELNEDDDDDEDEI